MTLRGTIANKSRDVETPGLKAKLTAHEKKTTNKIPAIKTGTFPELNTGNCASYFTTTLFSSLTTLPLSSVALNLKTYSPVSRGTK